MFSEGGVLFYEPFVRLTLFTVGLLVLGCVEFYYPFLAPEPDRRRRWLEHFFLMALGTLIGRVCFQIVPIVFAGQVQKAGVGLFSAVTWSFSIKVLLSLILIDLFMFLGHRALHRFSILWQFHKVHHTDKAIDVTTSLRFHPVEVILLLLFKGAAILCLGAPVLAIFIYEIFFCLFLQFAHANISLPKSLDRILKYLWVTPSMHRIHHSDLDFERNSNFGFCFSIWDRFFGSYLANCRSGLAHMIFGLEGYRAPVFQSLTALLLLPLALKKYAIKKPVPISRVRL